MKRYLFSIWILVIFILSIVTNWYYGLSISLNIVLLIMMLDKMGKGIVLREIVALLYAFTCLLMPIIGYSYYTKAFTLARLWGRFMPVPPEIYFSYALPAITLFCLAITLPTFSPAKDNEQGEGAKNLIFRIRKILIGYKNIGLVIIGIGIVVSFSLDYLPSGLQYFATLFFFGSFSGLLYVYYSPHFKYKKGVLLLFVLFIVYHTIHGGMFTIVAYMGINIFSFLLLGKTTSLVKKLSIVLVAAIFLLVLQNVKISYRSYIWHSNFAGNRGKLFADLFWENLQKGDNLIETTSFFPIYVRANQGYNVALVIRRIPAMQPYDNGNNLMKNFASAFVPRFLWPDKPEAGGSFNMLYYTGWRIIGFSTNVGPLGEAYGSFGVIGGIIYMFFLGLLIRWVYLKVFRIANRIPLLICWLPVIFYQVISSGETDSLQIFNSLIKSTFFIWLLYKFLPDWLGVSRNKRSYQFRKQIVI